MSADFSRFPLSSKRATTTRAALSALIALPLILSGSLLASQKEEPSNAESTLHVDVNLVTVGVLVMHQKGPLKTRLQAEDFILYEDGKPQKLSFFSSDEQPLSLVLLIDKSNSMAEGDKMDQVKSAVLSLIDSSHPNTEFSILAFHHSVSHLLDFSVDRERVRTTVRRLYAERGGSSFYDGLMESLEQASRAKYPRQALIVITDGADQHSQNTLEGIVRAVQSTQVEVFMIGVFSKKEEEIFQQSGKLVTLISGQEVDNPRYSFQRLAEESGAECYFPRSAKELAESMEHIRRDLQEQYTLAYYASAEGDGDRYRRIEVKSRKSGIKIRARKGYRLQATLRGPAHATPVTSSAIPDNLPHKERPYESRVKHEGNRTIYAENFESVDTGWPNSHEMYCRAGKFHMVGQQVPASLTPSSTNYGLALGATTSRSKPATALVVSNGPWLHDFRATVSLQGLDTFGDSSHPESVGAGGLVFRFNEKGYYALLLAGSGKGGPFRFSLIRKDVLSPEIVVIVPWTAAAVDHKTQSPLKLGVACEKNHLRLFLDDHKICELDDSSLIDGMVGMMLVGKGHAVFDDLIAEELAGE
jgi:Ca-activated chloride channel family protein